MIPADILVVLFIALIAAAAWAVLAGLGAKIAAKRMGLLNRRSLPSGERAHSAPAAALAGHRARFLPETTPAPIRPDVRGPCEESAVF